MKIGALWRLENLHRFWRQDVSWSLSDGNGICHLKRGTRAPFFQGHLWSLWWKVVGKTMKKNSKLLCWKSWKPPKILVETRSILHGYELILESFGINGNTYVHQQRICSIFCRVSGWLAMEMLEIWYPLVNVNQKLWKITIVNGTNSLYFDWAMASSSLFWPNQRVAPKFDHGTQDLGTGIPNQFPRRQAVCRIPTRRLPVGKAS